MRVCVGRCGFAVVGGRRISSRFADRCDPGATSNSKSLERVASPIFGQTRRGTPVAVAFSGVSKCP